MDFDQALLCIIGVVTTTVSGAAVPFAVSVSSRLSRIEALLEVFGKRIDKVEEIQNARLARELQKLHSTESNFSAPA